MIPDATIVAAALSARRRAGSAMRSHAWRRESAARSPRPGARAAGGSATPPSVRRHLESRRGRPCASPPATTRGTLAADAQAPFLLALYEKGELRERVALLRALAFLPEPERFAELAVERVPATTCRRCSRRSRARTRIPARTSRTRAFNQMVLKALFIGAPLAPIARPRGARHRRARAHGRRTTRASGARPGGPSPPTSRWLEGDAA